MSAPTRPFILQVLRLIAPIAAASPDWTDLPFQSVYEGLQYDPRIHRVTPAGA